MKQKISILGSTGSIGLQSLDIISKNKNSFIIYLLSANKNQNEICKQIIKHKPTANKPRLVKTTKSACIENLFIRNYINSNAFEKKSPTK